MRNMLIISVVAFAAGLSPVHAQSAAPVKVGETDAGAVLTDSEGRTLYTYTRDMPGHSNCNDACATAWPPLLAADKDKASGDYKIIARDDGKKQWAYKDKALYRFAKDAAPGDTSGDGLDKGKWQIAKP
ncbi:hypothetical protein [Emcibacter sp. SYSU 3D8]|uniref:COG4315 family predicted lipoprotein n=1 Tax=Emcibacter sp. SYSU 3D8 TaxID=3133969 RepID=UPI0031FF4566